MANRIEENIIGDQVLIPTRKGTEKSFEVLFAFVREDTGEQYMMVSPLDRPAGKEAGTQDVYAFRYREEKNDKLVLFFVEDGQEWQIVEEMFQMFLQRRSTAQEGG